MNLIVTLKLFKKLFFKANLIQFFIFFWVFFFNNRDNAEAHTGCGLNQSLICMCVACGSNFMSSLVFFQASLLKVHFQNFADFSGYSEDNFQGTLVKSDTTITTLRLFLAS